MPLLGKKWPSPAGCPLKARSCPLKLTTGSGSRILGTSSGLIGMPLGKEGTWAMEMNQSACEKWAALPLSISKNNFSGWKLYLQVTQIWSRSLLEMSRIVWDKIEWLLGTFSWHEHGTGDKVCCGSYETFVAFIWNSTTDQTSAQSITRRCAKHKGGLANVAVGSYASPESFQPLQMSSPSDSSGPSTSEFFLWHITKMLQVRLQVRS